jgi:hypothetical protein
MDVDTKTRRHSCEHVSHLIDVVANALHVTDRAVGNPGDVMPWHEAQSSHELCNAPQFDHPACRTEVQRLLMNSRHQDGNQSTSTARNWALLPPTEVLSIRGYE